MQGRLTTIHTNGKVEVADISNPARILDDLQGGVGGYIETVPYFNRFNGLTCIAFCHEEGKIKGDAFNPIATDLWKKQFPQNDDVLVGNVVVVTGDQEFMECL